MRILVTGAAGTVGRRVVRRLLSQRHRVVAFDRRPLRRVGIDQRQMDMILREITDSAALEAALSGVDAVIHLAAVIPPRADREPELARQVNVEGTRTLVAVMERVAPRARLIYASSIAVYGDRLRAPVITGDDAPAPNAADHYGRQKLEAEGLVRASSLSWTILRLSYVVAADALVMDPLLYDMPPETAIEPCDVRDVARAFCTAATLPTQRLGVTEPLRPLSADISGRTLLIAGGAEWRTMYRDYLGHMFRAFGLGGNFLPHSAFGTAPFHCAFMDTEESQRLLQYQRRSFADFMDEVRRGRRITRILVSVVRPLARLWLLSRSPYFRSYLGRQVSGELGRFVLRLRVAAGLRVPGRRRA